MANILDGSFEVNEFEFPYSYNIHFRTNTHGTGIKRPYLLSCG